MALDQRKYEHKHEAILRDVRPLSVRVADGMSNPSYSTSIFMLTAMAVYINEWAQTFGDLIVAIMFLYWLWLRGRDRTLAFKLPKGSKFKDMNNGRGGKPGKAEGILYLGNVEKTNEEVWFTNSDARTHILYLGTTGAGKTEGLKSMVTNALAWGSGFVYVDGKADTDLWSSLSSLVRRFGRDDDLLVLNYMTGNADVRAPSNTMNPFSSGSASYLVNMLVSLMPEAEGDNAMWKERAVSLISSIMPALTWKRDNQDIPLSVRSIRDYLTLANVIKLSRDEAVPTTTRAGLKGYLETLPGFINDAYDDNGKVKPPGPDTPQYNTETASQQHGYLAMQFTRSLQSLGDDYGYIFDTQAADVDMVDVVLNRRILIVLIPALEKSGDEVANLGKIVSATMKGMMGSTLGSTVEGSSETVIENKPTHSATPFMTVFDEVGYYTAQGMAVMAAQARSLGFCLVFSGQDLPAMKKRVREEANSIVGNCNIKIFGKLEDPTETKDFFEKTVGSAMVTEVSGFQMAGGTEFGAYHDTKQAGVQLRPRASYDSLRGFREGQAVVTFGDTVVDCAIFYSNPGHAKAMRVTRFMILPPPDEEVVKHSTSIRKLRDLMVNKSWTAMRADVAIETSKEVAAMNEGFKKSLKPSISPVDAGIAALVSIHAIDHEIPATDDKGNPPPAGGGGGGSGGGPAAPSAPPTAPPATTPAAPATVSGSSPVAQVAQKAAPPLVAKKPAEIVKQAETVTGSAPATAETAKAGAAPMSFFSKSPASTTPPPTTSAPPPPATPAAPPPVSAPPAEKPAIFGGTPVAKTPVQPPASPPATTPPAAPATEKPAVFGGTPAAKSPAEPPATPPAAPPPAATTPPPASSGEGQQPPEKPAIFGSAPATQTPAAAAQAPPLAAPPAEKPAIFGGTPAAQTPPAAETAQPVTPPPAPPVTPPAATAPPPASSGEAQQPPPEKPAIFSSQKPATPPPAETAALPQEAGDTLKKAGEDLADSLLKNGNGNGHENGDGKSEDGENKS
ncbi:MAG: type IV secretion system DNA-binding domain-containing protein [Rhodospirillales bacterium]|nr:type IV secretion system DNA-binding domain-containing protein [Rhodospirillales bacterium]